MRAGFAALVASTFAASWAMAAEMLRPSAS
jgi:hypothetical protein